MPTTQLEYTSTPELSFASKSIKLTIDGRNNTNDVIEVPKGSSITIVIPKAMVTDLDLQASTPPDSGYYVEKGKVLGEYVVKPNPFGGTIEIQPNVSWKISFASTSLSDTSGNYFIKVAETLGEKSGDSEVKFIVEEEQQKVIAWLDPKYIGDQELSKLYWQAPKGITSLTISGYPNKADVPVKNPSLDGNVEVFMLPGTEENQRIYSVNVLAGGNLIKSKAQVLQKNDPVISAFVATQATAADGELPEIIDEIGIDEKIYLNWITDYASSVILTTPTIPNKLVAKNDQKVEFNPGTDILNAYYGFLDQLPATAVFYLTVNGAKRPKPQKIELNIRPIKLLYFRYKTSKKVNVEYATEPENYSGVEVVYEGGKQTLTLYQVGGKVEIYHPTDPKK